MAVTTESCPTRQEKMRFIMYSPKILTEIHDAVEANMIIFRFPLKTY